MVSKEKEYEVVTTKFYNDFVRTVNAYLNNGEGWQLVGGVSITAVNDCCIYAQSLVREI